MFSSCGVRCHASLRVVPLAGPQTDLPFRITFVYAKANGILLGQRCVETAYETVSEALIPVGEEIIFVFAARRMFYDPFGDLAKSIDAEKAGVANGAPLVPLLGVTHSHRVLKGSAWSDGRWVKLAAASAAYTSTFAELLARCWSRALQQIDRQD